MPNPHALNLTFLAFLLSKVANMRISQTGVQKRRTDKDKITLTVKLKASVPQLIRRRNEIENDLR